MSKTREIQVLENKGRGIVTKYHGKRTFKDIETGEIVELEYAQKSVKRGLKGGWRRVYLSDFMEILTSFASKRIDVVEYILDNLNSENQFLKSQREVATALEISLKTVSVTFVKLQEMDFIKRTGPVYTVNPKFVCAFGSDQKNANILIKYQEEEQNLFN